LVGKNTHEAFMQNVSGGRLGGIEVFADAQMVTSATVNLSPLCVLVVITPFRVPVNEKNPPVGRPSLSGQTFQVRPAPRDADMRLPQATFAAGLPVAMFDGSVRTIRPGVTPEVFWAQVTPAGGEVISGD
jgi:hypothetical protein